MGGGVDEGVFGTDPSFPLDPPRRFFTKVMNSLFAPYS